MSLHDEILRAQQRAAAWRFDQRIRETALSDDVNGVRPGLRTFHRAADHVPLDEPVPGPELKRPPAHGTRRYLPTLADLIDRLVITQQKAIFIHEHAGEYNAEMALILHDIDLILTEEHAINGRRIGAGELRAVIICALANREIWLNESKARQGGGQQDGLLKFTHSVNGVRNTAKNAIACAFGERKDHKVDCFAAELVKDFGNWDVFT